MNQQQAKEQLHKAVEQYENGTITLSALLTTIDQTLIDLYDYAYSIGLAVAYDEDEDDDIEFEMLDDDEFTGEFDDTDSDGSV